MSTNDISTNINPDKPIHFVKYETSIYAIGVLGAISQMAAVIVICAHLITGLGLNSDEDKERATIYSGIGMALLTGTAFSEILLLRAVNQRMAGYIQWWMVSSLVILIFSILMTVISGCTLFEKGLWITLSFAYIVIRLPFQMYFVDNFAHAEIFHKQATIPGHYTSVLYRRFL